MATPTNLPATAVSGEILTAAYVNNLRGAFRVLQVKSFTTTTLATSASTTYSASGLTLSITPQSTSSQILIMTSHSIAKTAGGIQNSLDIRIRRGTTVLQEQKFLLFTDTFVIGVGTTSFLILDSPNTVSAVTYDAQFRNFQAASQVEIQANGSPSTIILMEISA